jgi:hypothetical protein
MVTLRSCAEGYAGIEIKNRGRGGSPVKDVCLDKSDMLTFRTSSSPCAKPISDNKSHSGCTSFRVCSV